MDKIKVGVLGALGAVGQRFISLLENHPYFELESLIERDDLANREYHKTVNWILSGNPPDFTKEKRLESLNINSLKERDVKLIFSAIPSDPAKILEKKISNSGLCVFSNAGAYRMEPNVPLVIPEVNHGALSLIKKQENGFIVTNPNCTTTAVALALAPLRAFGIEEVLVSSYQALSGAGYPGVPSLDILGNVVPYIGGEEEKVEEESKKILSLPELKICASCVRVPVKDGHLESVVVKLREGSLDEVIESMRNYKSLPQEEELPTAPIHPLIIREEKNRPQPQYDVMAGEPARARGMAVTAGRFKEKDGNIRFFVLMHNTIRGAAGGSILNAEIAHLKGYV